MSDYDVLKKKHYYDAYSWRIFLQIDSVACLVVAVHGVETEVPASAVIFPANYQLVECNSFVVFLLNLRKCVFIALSTSPNYL